MGLVGLHSLGVSCGAQLFFFLFASYPLFFKLIYPAKKHSTTHGTHVASISHIALAIRSNIVYHHTENQYRRDTNILPRCPQCRRILRRTSRSSGSALKMGLSLSCVRRLQAALANVLTVFSLLLTYAQGIEQSTTRHRSGAFFYRRQEGDVDLERGLRPPPTRPPQELKPVIHSSRDGDENAPLERAKEAAKAKAAGDK